MEDGGTFADDMIAAATADELNERVQLVLQLVANAGANRAAIVEHVAEARRLTDALGAWLVGFELPADDTTVSWPVPAVVVDYCSSIGVEL